MSEHERRESPTTSPATADFTAGQEINNHAADGSSASAEKTDALAADLGGRYELRRLLGRGGMGCVYLARDRTLGRDVALKMPRFEAGRPELIERFYREARSAAALNHPGICPIFDVNEHNGTPYLTMAFVEGPTLAEMLRERGPLPSEEAARIVREVAQAMHEAHRAGVVHRDLKPGNVMLDRAGRAVVMDFGLARQFDIAPEQCVTRFGMVLGTPAYMAPEQTGGDPATVGPAADIWALGVILYELLTGQRPFTGASLGQLFARIAADEPLPPSVLRPTLPPALDAVVRTALAKDPSRRYTSMAAFADALESAALAMTPTDLAPADTPPTASAPRRRPTTPALLIGAGLVLVALVVLGVVFYVQTDYGTVEVRLSDPNAKVDVRVDGDVITLEEPGQTTTVRPGRHKLIVSSPDFETVTEEFTLRRGTRRILTVTLRRKEPPVPIAQEKLPTVVKTPEGKLPAVVKTPEGKLPVVVKTPEGKLPPVETKKFQQPKAVSPEDRARVAVLIQKLMRVARTTNDGEEMIRLANQALALDPASADAYAWRGTGYGNVKQRDKALKDCATAIRLDPRCVLAYLTRSYVYDEDTENYPAIADATIVIRLAPTEVMGYVNRSFSYMRIGEDHQTIHDCKQALKLDETEPLAWGNLALAYAHLGKYREALEAIGRGIEIAPGRADFYSWRASIALNFGDRDQARKDLAKLATMKDDPLAQKIVRDGPNRLAAPPTRPAPAKLTAAQAENVRTWLQQAKVAFDRGEYPAIITAATKVLALDPYNVPALELRAAAYSPLRQFDEALRDAEAAIRLSPDASLAYATRGKIRLEKGRLEPAIADLTIAIQQSPTRAEWHNDRAVCYLRRGNLDQALADVDAAIVWNDTFGLAYANRSHINMLLGHYKDALKDADKAIRCQPKNASFYWSRARLHNHFRDLAKAAADQKQAIALDASYTGRELSRLPEPVVPAVPVAEPGPAVTAPPDNRDVPPDRRSIDR